MGCNTVYYVRAKSFILKVKNWVRPYKLTKLKHTSNQELASCPSVLCKTYMSYICFSRNTSYILTFSRLQNVMELLRIPNYYFQAITFCNKRGQEC